MKISKADLDDLYECAKQSKLPEEVRSKYGSTKTEIDGIKFDSKKEGHRYRELKFQLKAGHISNLELQPEFILQEKFRHKGKGIRAIKYLADFKYTKDGVEIIEDVKGYKKKEIYVLKKKILFYKFPDINFIET